MNTSNARKVVRLHDTARPKFAEESGSGLNAWRSDERLVTCLTVLPFSISRAARGIHWGLPRAGEIDYRR